MRYICFFIIGLFMLSSCSENDRMTYRDKSAVYFSEYVEGADSLVYSFFISGKSRDTVDVYVKILGVLPEKPMKYKVSVSENSTAIAGKHYTALPEFFEYPANTSIASFPVEVLKIGTELDDKTVVLELRLEPTEDLGIGYLDRLKMRLMITNQLVKPYYWDMPLSLYFGEYSKAKHQKCIEIMGHDFPLKESELMGWNGTTAYTYWMLQGRVVCQYYATHEEYDENGNRIEVWSPF